MKSWRKQNKQKRNVFACSCYWLWAPPTTSSGQARHLLNGSSAWRQDVLTLLCHLASIDQTTWSPSAHFNAQVNEPVNKQTNKTNKKRRREWFINEIVALDSTWIGTCDVARLRGNGITLPTEWIDWQRKVALIIQISNETLQLFCALVPGGFISDQRCSSVLERDRDASAISGMTAGTAGIDWVTRSV